MGINNIIKSTNELMEALKIWNEFHPNLKNLLDDEIDDLGFDTVAYAVDLSIRLRKNPKDSFNFFIGYCAGRTNNL